MDDYTREELVAALRSWVTAEVLSESERVIAAAADMLEQDGERAERAWDDGWRDGMSRTARSNPYRNR